MNNYLKTILIITCALKLTACNTTMVDSPYYGSSTIYSPSSYFYNDSQLYTPYNNYNERQSYSHKVVVPDSYHVGETHSPVSFKDRDRAWVSNQSPQSYTIEVADGDQAAQVAQKLYKAPKSDRMAQVRYQRDGKSYYRGVYGSYATPQDAQKALDALPAEVKQGASVKSWSGIQSNLQ